MPLRHLAVLVFAVLATLVLPAGAQWVCPVITPNPVAPGSPMTITVADASGFGFSYRTNCLATTLHAGTPNGTIIGSALQICSINPVTVAPYGSAMKTLTVPAGAPQGFAFWKVQYFLPGATTLTTEWANVLISSGTPAPPSLVAQTPARVGFNYVLDLNWPAGAGGVYLAAASFTTNTGINAGPGLFIALDPDAVFQLSFPAPVWPLFLNFQGSLDAAGFAGGLTISIPQLPALAYLPLHVQAAIIQPGAVTTLSNVVDTCIAP